MAQLEKFTNDAITMLLKHDSRSLKNDSNTDIRSDRSGLNYAIPCNQSGLTDLEHYKQLLGNSYLYGRGTKREQEAITCCSWVVTLPTTISNYYSADMQDNLMRLNPAEESAFFQGVHRFISDRYGSCFHASIHYDEGGQPHGHFYVVPITPLDHNKVHYKTVKTHTAARTDSGRYEFQYKFKTDENGARISLKNYAKMSDYYTQKISGADVFNKAELQHFHQDLADYLRKNQIPGADQIYTGVTGGKNISVQSLKEIRRSTGLTLTEIKELQINKEKLQVFIQEKDLEISNLQNQITSKNLELSRYKERIRELENSLELVKTQIHPEPEHVWGKTEQWGHRSRSFETKEHLYERED